MACSVEHCRPALPPATFLLHHLVVHPFKQKRPVRRRGFERGYFTHGRRISTAIKDTLEVWVWCTFSRALTFHPKPAHVGLIKDTRQEPCRQRPTRRDDDDDRFLQDGGPSPPRLGGESFIGPLVCSTQPCAPPQWFLCKIRSDPHLNPDFEICGTGTC